MDALRLEHADGIAVVTIDLPNEPVNKVTAALRSGFARLFDEIERDPAVRGVVLMSGKRDTWLAGADIDEFLTLRSASDAETLSRTGQTLLARLERLRVPVVAAIHGACLGGGLETALACRWRIATEHPKTPKCSSGSSPAPAARSACHASSGFSARSTSCSPAATCARRRRSRWGSSTSSCIRRSCARSPSSALASSPTAQRNRRAR
jgi:hypothetical protein